MIWSNGFVMEDEEQKEQEMTQYGQLLSHTDVWAYAATIKFLQQLDKQHYGGSEGEE